MCNGKPNYLPIDEKHPLDPHSPYNKSKLIGEDLCRNYSFDYGIDVVSLRVFSLYGPQGRSGSFIQSVIEQINKNGRALLTKKDIRRDFMFISDFVDLVLLILKDFPHGYNVYNVGSGKSYSLEDVCILISRLLKRELVIRYSKGSRVRVINNIVADISKVCESFHWKPCTTIGQGLGITIKSNK